MRTQGCLLLDEISLEVKEGEVIWILGPSGAGKTTLLRALAGIEPIASGRISVDGVEVAAGQLSLPPERRRVGMVFQDPALFPHLDVLDNVTFGLVSNGSSDGLGKARDLLERVGLAGFEKRLPHMLSGGEQQRVALARTLASEPAVVLLDEPFTGLEPQLRTELANMVCRVLREEGRTALLTGHAPEDAMRFSDRIVLMHSGRICQAGTPVEVYEAPVDSFCASILGLVNRNRAQVEAEGVATPFGHLSADGLAAGTAAEWLVREEGFVFNGSGRSARVVEVRPLGALALIRLDFGEGWPLLHARLPATETPGQGDEVEVSLDPSRSFIFPVEE